MIPFFLLVPFYPIAIGTEKLIPPLRIVENLLIVGFPSSVEHPKFFTAATENMIDLKGARVRKTTPNTAIT
jgi:hypothetical protein